MQRLDLDFASSPRNLGRADLWLGLGVFLLGLVALSFALMQYREQLESNDALRLQRELLQLHAEKKPRAAVSSETATAREQAYRAFAELATPWEQLFQELERSRSEGIALLSLSADAEKRVLAIGGEAKDFEELNRFSDALASSPLIAAVNLSNHRLSEGAPPIVVKFELKLAWRAGGQ